MMLDYFFAQDLLIHKKDKETRGRLIKQKEIKKEFLAKNCGKEIMVIYIDIYGNEFREKFKIKGI